MLYIRNQRDPPKFLFIFGGLLTLLLLKFSFNFLLQSFKLQAVNLLDLQIKAISSSCISEIDFNELRSIMKQDQFFLHFKQFMESDQTFTVILSQRQTFTIRISLLLLFTFLEPSIVFLLVGLHKNIFV